VRISVGIPVFNEQDVIPDLLTRLLRVLDGIPGGPHEVVFVDDGSTDGSRRLLLDAAARGPPDPDRRALPQFRPSGGARRGAGPRDRRCGRADGCRPPGSAGNHPEFVKHHEGGADVVFARRASREEGWVIRTSYRLFYRIIAALSDTPLPLDSGDFALLGAPVVAMLRRLPERSAICADYARGSASRRSASTSSGAPGLPARPSTPPGSCSSWRSTASARSRSCRFAPPPSPACWRLPHRSLRRICRVCTRRSSEQVPVGFTASLLITTFLSGVQLLFLGIIGEYLGRVYGETKGRPPYVVAKIMSAD
jgi:glycosyltransferase involved in cell wall biosynthesis